MGTLNGSPANATPIPIMAHPPANTSDLSVVSFLEQIHEHNEKNANNVKGIKMDFKSIDVVDPSIDALLAIDTLWPNEIWLNADIIQGPVDDKKTPVDPKRFLASCRKYPQATLSIGWTTLWGNDYTVGDYTAAQIEAMKVAIRGNQVPEAKSPITFPVRAGIAAQSKDRLHELMAAFNETNAVTLTIWSSVGDAVNVELLRDLIFSTGLDKVYVDVPQELSSQLRLDDPNHGFRLTALNAAVLIGTAVVLSLISGM